MKKSISKVGTVEAGFPSPGGDSQDEEVSLDDYIIDNREASFMVRMKGDAMASQGIYDGDMIVVERGRNARAGDFVIVRTVEDEGSFVIRKYRDAVQEFGGDIYIEAVVVAVIRKYGK